KQKYGCIQYLIRHFLKISHASLSIFLSVIFIGSTSLRVEYFSLICFGRISLYPIVGDTVIIAPSGLYLLSSNFVFFNASETIKNETIIIPAQLYNSLI